MKIFVLDEMHPAGIEWMSERAEVIPWDDPRCSHWHDQAEGLMIRTAKVTAQDFARAKKLRVVSKQGVGINSIDVQAASSHGITVCNTPGINRVAVAEMTMALVMNLARRVSLQDRLIRAGTPFNRNHHLGLELTGKTVGIIGMGHIGTEFARKMWGAFESKLLAYDPFQPRPEWKDWPHRRVTTLAEMLADSDVVSLHVPYTPSNHHLIDAHALSLMKPGALLVNVSRGGLIDEQALFQALSEGRLGGAALDVWEEVEPPRPDHPLLSLPQVIATPHAAGSTTDTQRASSMAVAQQLWHVLQGGEPWHRVV